MAAMSDDALADARSLPLLGEVVPDVLAVDRAVATHPRPHQVGSQRDRALHQERAPVVADEVDRLTDTLELADEPLPDRDPEL